MKFKNVSGVIPFFISLALIPFAVLLLYRRTGMGNNPWIFLAFFTIVVTVAVLLYGWMSKQILGETRYEGVFLFAGAMLSCFVFWKLLRRAAFEWNWQDTRYVFSSFSVLLSVFFFYFIFAAVYYIYTKRTTNNPNIYFTRIHFWMSFLGISFYLWNHLSANSLTNPVQLKNAGKEALFHRVEFLNTNDLVIVVLLALAQLLFIYHLIRPGRMEGRDKQPGLNGSSKRT